MQALTRWWKNFESMHPTVAQFIVFFVLSNGITVLQLVLMPAFKAVFAHTSLVDTAFQFLPVGVSHGHTVFLFDYSAGSMSVGGGGGLAYFLAVEITLLIAQVINFFAQRNVTFKSNSSMGKAALLVRGGLRRHHDRGGCPSGPLQGPDLRVGHCDDGRGRRDCRRCHHDDHQRRHLLLGVLPHL